MRITLEYFNLKVKKENIELEETFHFAPKYNNVCSRPRVQRICSRIYY